LNVSLKNLASSIVPAVSEGISSVKDNVSNYPKNDSTGLGEETLDALKGGFSKLNQNLSANQEDTF